MTTDVPVPRPLRRLTRDDVALGLMYTSGGYWCSAEENAAIEAALADPESRRAGDLFDQAGALLAALLMVEFERQVAQRAGFVGTCLFLHVNRRPAPRGLDQDAAFDLVTGAAECRIGALEAGERLRALWSVGHDHTEER
ncbi:hypothetical protein [Segniliparus rugosus]|uniref:Uncharacterized protein n=1 Tax=Segniliparus rugosus (strain ATCC BAA-974 / DSM 45345 / CCUG 50838 / CIP 108380 / JCM 13579 / CDC 945) TaxID=679197 RepID=E5XT55_SEGRC|nr:hypothetical protein [Segniliparus rugosus]EFV12466.1 hypothetical protein HMPREF9336_02677 [Segniliparus rugosus ATCC BAA-974]